MKKITLLMTVPSWRVRETREADEKVAHWLNTRKGTTRTEKKSQQQEITRDTKDDFAIQFGMN
ncbi:hypothetical protein RUM43_000275, partial [Polyplax serrata]